jgi:hypothetical protein
MAKRDIKALASDLGMAADVIMGRLVESFLVLKVRELAPDTHFRVRPTGQIG